MSGDKACAAAQPSHASWSSDVLNRQALLELMDSADQRAAASVSHLLSANLLGCIVWTVTDPPERAYIDLGPQGRQHARDSDDGSVLNHTASLLL
jgi:hypothetical protein